MIPSAVERNFQVAVGCVLDIGNHIIAEEGFEGLDDNEDIIRILGEEGIISLDLAERMKGLAGFRNIIVHLLDDFRQYARYISSYLDKNG